MDRLLDLRDQTIAFLNSNPATATMLDWGVEDWLHAARWLFFAVLAYAIIKALFTANGQVSHGSTQPGYVYLAAWGPYLKVGMTGSPAGRERSLGGGWRLIDVQDCSTRARAFEVERYYHQRIARRAPSFGRCYPHAGGTEVWLGQEYRVRRLNDL